MSHPPVSDPIADAKAVALRHSVDDKPGIRRLRRGRAFVYVRPRGGAVRDAATLTRIRMLAIPPAWRDVWIAPDPDGHLQATGRDARGRKQYRYHPRWREVRDQSKYHRLVAFCDALPRLRKRIDRDLACRCLCRDKVVATVLALMERAQLRVGNDEYERANGSYGATTLRDRHARIHGATLELAYRAKGGLQRRVRVTDRRLARIVRSCRDLPGQRLFQYLEDGRIKGITSTDVNAYVHAVTGGPFTAKDYRTWAATLGAALLLSRCARPASATAAKRCIREVLGTVAEQLGHTVAICRASYVHPKILEDFANHALPALGRGAKPEICVETLRAIERAVAKHLHG